MALTPVAVPDGTTWTDDQGNTWTSNGADVTVTPGDLAVTGAIRIEQTA